MFDSLNNSKLSSLLNFKFNNTQENEVNGKGDKYNKWNEKLENSQIKKRFEINWSEIQEAAITNNARCNQINELIINIHQNQYRQKIKLQELNTNLSYLPEVNKELKIINEKIGN
ncbi:hypothetical protein K502DRAFT_70866 [Neoconidiobolus thromboides FSU 785]|nr:hypothetical protein K502DRAFT_70866 [Neoconidiobolus thromboides FSU 785]